MAVDTIGFRSAYPGKMYRWAILGAILASVAIPLGAVPPPANPALPPVDPPVSPRTERYGEGPFERLAIVPSSTPRPLIAIVDDSGLAPSAGLGTGYLLRSLSRHYTVAVVETSDPLYHGVGTRRDEIADAIRYLLRGDPRSNIDPTRIVLIGDGDGAGAIVDVICNPAALRRSGIDAGALRGIVLIDGFGMDLAAERAGASSLVRSRIDKADKASLSIDAATCPAVPFRLIAVTSRSAHTAISDAFARRLMDAGIAVSRDSLPVPDSKKSASWFGHSINRATRALLDWIADRL